MRVRISASWKRHSAQVLVKGIRRLRACHAQARKHLGLAAIRSAEGASRKLRRPVKAALALVGEAEKLTAEHSINEPLEGTPLRLRERMHSLRRSTAAIAAHARAYYNPKPTRKEGALSQPTHEELLSEGTRLLQVCLTRAKEYLAKAVAAAGRRDFAAASRAAEIVLQFTAEAERISERCSVSGVLAARPFRLRKTMQGVEGRIAACAAQAREYAGSAPALPPPAPDEVLQAEPGPPALEPEAEVEAVAESAAAPEAEVEEAPAEAEAQFEQEEPADEGVQAAAEEEAEPGKEGHVELDLGELGDLSAADGLDEEEVIEFTAADLEEMLALEEEEGLLSEPPPARTNGRVLTMRPPASKRPPLPRREPLRQAPPHVKEQMMRHILQRHYELLARAAARGVRAPVRLHA